MLLKVYMHAVLALKTRELADFSSFSKDKM